MVALVLMAAGLVIAFLLSQGPPRVAFIAREPSVEAEAYWRGRDPVIRIAGRTASLKPRAKGRPDTVLSVGDPDPHRGGLSLFESGRKRPGDEDRLVGDVDFDRAWAVQGPDVPRFFSPEARAPVMAAVGALRRFKRPRVLVSPKGLEIRLKDHLKSPEDRTVLLRAAEVLLEVMKARAEPVLLWMESREGGAGLCQVCGSDILSPPVLCRACRTPHHEECWTYAGRCSTYGCGQRSFVRA